MAVRQTLAEQIYPLATFFLENAPQHDKGYSELITTFIPYTFELIIDKNVEVSRAATRSLVKIGELIQKEHIQPQLLTVIHNLSHDDRVEEYRIAGAALFCELAPIFGEKLCRTVVVKELMQLSDDLSLLVRKTVAQHIGKVCEIVGVQTTVQYIVPFYLQLAKDEIWGVRQACAEVLPIVSSFVTNEVRLTKFIPLFEAFMDDATRWVKMEALKQLGPFIATFALNPPKPSFSSNRSLPSLSSHGFLRAPSAQKLVDDAVATNQDHPTPVESSGKTKSTYKKAHCQDIECNLDETTAQAIKPLIHYFINMASSETNELNNAEGNSPHNIKRVSSLSELSNTKVVDPDLEDAEESVAQNNTVENRKKTTQKILNDIENSMIPTGDDSDEVGSYGKPGDDPGNGDPNAKPNGSFDFAEFCAYNFPAVIFTLGKKYFHLLSKSYIALVKNGQWKVRRTLAFSLHDVAKLLGTQITESVLKPAFEALLKDLDEVRIGVIKNLSEFLEVLSAKERTKYLTLISSLPIHPRNSPENAANNASSPGDASNDGTQKPVVHEFSTIKNNAQNQQNGNSDQRRGSNGSMGDADEEGGRGSDEPQNSYDNWRIRNEIAAQLGKLSYLFIAQQVRSQLLKMTYALLQDPFCEVRRTAAETTGVILKRVSSSGDEKAQEELINFLLSMAKMNSQKKLVFLWCCSSILHEEIDPELFEKHFVPAIIELGYDKVPNIRIEVAKLINNQLLQTKPYSTFEALQTMVKKMKGDTDKDVQFFADTVTIMK